jgi:hypothetical protein
VLEHLAPQLTCVAKSMTGTARPRPPFAPTGPEIPRPVVAAVTPRKGRLRRDLALVAAAIAIVLVSIEAGVLVVNAASGNPSATPTNNSIAVAGTPTASPSLSPTPTDSPAPTDSPTPLPTFSASPSPSPSLSPTPAVTVAPPPAPTPVAALMKPTISCIYSGTKATCHVSNGATYWKTDHLYWNFGDGGWVTTTKNVRSASWTYPDNTTYHFITLTVRRSGTADVVANGSVVPV